jgi:hypothetical protein
MIPIRDAIRRIQRARSGVTPLPDGRRGTDHDVARQRG